MVYLLFLEGERAGEKGFCARAQHSSRPPEHAQLGEASGLRNTLRRGRGGAGGRGMHSADPVRDFYTKPQSPPYWVPSILLTASLNPSTSPSHSPLVAGLTSHDRIALESLSAGGVTAGSLLNRRPSAVVAALLEAPFVDVLTAMCDPGLPLTMHEYEEWGDPADPQAFQQVQEQAGKSAGARSHEY